jgi:hypothetical protein
MKLFDFYAAPVSVRLILVALVIEESHYEAAETALRRKRQREHQRSDEARTLRRDTNEPRQY